jgi:hypothetical protein
MERHGVETRGGCARRAWSGWERGRERCVGVSGSGEIVVAVERGREGEQKGKVK